ncbi:MAG: 3-deoxy-D-manno-octulosonic acid transferase [Planctomycetota bacterium]|jgi:3-deoxy-D-manno-octulosonic-acid transferase
MRVLIDFLYLVAAIGFCPKLIYRALKQERYHKGWSERFGKIKRRQPEKKCIWIHAVSVGEVNATKTIIHKLEEQFVDYEIVISTTTDTGYARANAIYGEKFYVFYFPLDFSWIMKKAFKVIQPSICLLIELEVWPNLVDIAKRLNIPVVVVNGRISEKSFGRYKKVRPFIKRIFEKMTLVLSQTEEYAKRFREIGTPAEKIVVTGSLKYDTAQIADKVKGAYELAVQLGIDDEKLLVAGGTGNDEEEIIVNVFKRLKEDEKFRDLRLVVVPRKPERFDEVAQVIEQAELSFVRYSSLKNTDEKCNEKTDVILGDTMGDLRKFYSLATIIFVGRSLVPMGGSDMMEAAALGKCTMFGPYAFNFRQTVDVLLQGEGALLVEDKEDLYKTVSKCLTEIEFAHRIAENGQEVIRKNQGATEETINAIRKFLNN